MIEDKIQGGIEWKRQRLGKITGSEIYVLTKNHKRAMTDEELAAFKAANPKSRVTTVEEAFSDATYTYLNRKVMENYLPLTSQSIAAVNAVNEYIEEHTVSNKAMQYGTFWEDAARRRYAEVMNCEVLEVGFEPYKQYPNLVGVSPDGMVRESKGGVEIKCPFTMEKHLQHFLYSTPLDLKENDEQYYWQCVACMLVTDCDYWDFVSFNPYLSVSKQLKILRIPRDEQDINLLRSRITLSVEYMREKMRELDNIPIIIK